MTTINHKILSGDIDLALIEGTEVEAYCTIKFVPTLTVGSSGRADVPGAPICEDCTRLQKIHLRWAKNRDEYNRIAREQRALQNEFKSTRVAIRSGERQPAEVTT